MQKVEALTATKACLRIESVKESEKNFDDTESTRNDDYDADEILKTTKPDPTKINLLEIGKENYDKTKLRDLRFLLDPEKDHYNKAVKTVSAFNNNYIQHESIGDKDENLSIKE